MDERGRKEETKSLNETKVEKKPTHLDGGYGWVVVAACFVVHTLQIGYLRAFGLLFVKFLAEFKAPASYTSTIMGIQSAIFSLTSLLVLSVFIDYWSIRGYAMLGATLTSLGVAISYFAENVEYLIFSQSLLIGVGNAFTYGPGVVLIGRYFKKRLALANAIANAGVSAGAVIIPIIIPLLMDEFGLRGGLLNLGGIMAQMIICTTLYRDPGKHPVEESTEVHVEDFKSLESFYSLPEQVVSKDKVVEATPVLPHDKDNAYPFPTDRNIFRERTLSNRSYQTDLVKPLNSPPKKHNTFLTEPSGHLPRKTHASESHSIVDTLSRSRMLLYASNPNLVYASVVDLKPTTEPRTSEEKETGKDKSKLLSKFKNILDLSLFKNPIFWVVAGFTPTCMCGSALATAFIPALGEEIGLDDTQTSLLLTISGALDIVSRLVPGILAELNVMRTPHMVVISMFSLGVLFQFVSFFDTYALMLVLVCMYGILGGVYFSLLAVVIIELMGFESFTKVFGFVQVFHGASGALCYPVLGGLRDITGTYVTCFQFLGACAIVGSIILALEPLARKYASKKYNGKTQYDIVPSNETNGKTKSKKENV